MAIVKKKTKPAFRRPNYGRKSRERIKANWRRPRGIDNKKRMKIQRMGCSPSIGYRNDKTVRGVHPAGKRELLVENLAQLEGAKDVFVRIAGGVGKKLRQKLMAKCSEKSLKVLNPN